MSKQLRERNAQAYLFLSPFLIFITVLYILPAIITVAMAFTDLDGAFVWGFNGLNNFRKILIDPNTPVIALNTVLYVGISIFFTVVLDLFFAHHDHLFYPRREEGEPLQIHPDDPDDYPGGGLLGAVAVAARGQ